MYDCYRDQAVKRVSAEIGLTPEGFRNAVIDAALSTLAQQLPGMRSILQDIYAPAA